MRRAGALGEIFGVAGERHAGVVDHALLHRRRDDGGELAAARRPRSRGRAGRARGARWPGRAGRRCRARPAARRARCSRPARRRLLRHRTDRERARRCRPSWRARSVSSARLPMMTSGQGSSRAAESEAEIRADAGGLARGDGDAGFRACTRRTPRRAAGAATAPFPRRPSLRAARGTRAGGMISSRACRTGGGPATG